MPMSKKPSHLRTIVGGRAAIARTLVLEVRAFDDPTIAMQASVKALSAPRDTTRVVSVAAVRELLTDQRLALLRVIRKERPASVAELVGRTPEAVKADLEVLAHAGAVTFESPTAKSQVRTPRVAYDRVEIRLEL